MIQARFIGGPLDGGQLILDSRDRYYQVKICRGLNKHPFGAREEPLPPMETAAYVGVVDVDRRKSGDQHAFAGRPNTVRIFVLEEEYDGARRVS